MMTSTLIKPVAMWRRGLAANFDAVIVFCGLLYAAGRWGVELPNGTRGWHGLGATAVMCLVAAYWILPEWWFGATLGKLIFGIRVVSASAGGIALLQSLKRNVLRPIDFTFFYLTGFIVAMLNPRRQRLGDHWARTIVVESRRRSEE